MGSPLASLPALIAVLLAGASPELTCSCLGSGENSIPRRGAQTSAVQGMGEGLGWAQGDWCVAEGMGRFRRVALGDLCK